MKGCNKYMAVQDEEKSFREEFKTTMIVSVPIFIVAEYLILQYYAYSARWPELSMEKIISKMTEILPKYPFAFPASPVSGIPVALLASVFYVLLMAFFWSKGKSNVHARKGTENGTAHWYTDLKKWDRKYRDSTEQHNMIFTKDVYMDMDTRRTKRNNNVFVIGGSGAGKSRFFVKPNLCELPLNTSFVVTDPAGEMLSEIGYLLEGAGYEIKVFILVNMKESGRYNPLKYVHTETDIIQLTDCLLANTSDPNSKGEDFWEKAQKMLFQAYLYLIWKHGKEFGLKQNLNTLIQLMLDTAVSEEETSNSDRGQTDKYFVALETAGWWKNKNTGEIRFDKPSMAEESAFERHEPVGANDIAVKEYKKFRTGAGKTLKSILISAEARLSAMSPQAVVDLVDEDDINIETLGDKKSALFIIIPQGNKSFNFLAAILYTQLFQFLYYHAQYECQGSYLVEDSRGEIVKMFNVSHEKTDEQLMEESAREDEEIEIEISSDNLDGSKKKKQKKKKGRDVGESSSIAKKADKGADDDADDENQEDHPETVPDDSPGQEDENVKALAEEFAKLANKVKCVKKGNKYIIKMLHPNGTEEVVDVYGIEEFANKRAKAIQEGCKVRRCGLYLPYHVRFMLDEFANIGKIPEFEEKLATMRKYEISASIITQNLAQLKKMYEKDWGTIIGNCDSFLFLGCPEYDTNKYVSEMLGTTTITVKNRSESHGKGGGSSSYNSSKRELITPDELRRLDNDECIYLQRGENPFRTKKHPYTTHRNFRYTADEDKSLTYYYHKPIKKRFGDNESVAGAVTPRNGMTVQQLTESSVLINEYLAKAKEAVAYNAGSKKEECDCMLILSTALARSADEVLSDDEFGEFFDISQEYARKADEVKDRNTQRWSGNNTDCDNSDDKLTSSSSAAMYFQ